MQRTILATFGVLSAFSLAHAAGFGFGGSGGGSTDNLMTIYDQSPGCNTNGQAAVGLSGPGGRISAPIALTGGETTLIQIVVGDSVSANSGQSAYTPTNTVKNQNFNPYTGLNYQALDPMLGASNVGPGGYPLRIADKLITAGKFARVITINTSLGGHCSSDAAKSGAMNHRQRIACLWARALGWPISGSSGTWRLAILYAMGINDNARGVVDPTHPVSPATFTANAQSFFQSMIDYGCTGHVFVAKSTMYQNAVNTGLQGAQAGLVDNVSVFVGADTDSLTGANRQTDNTHLSDIGNDANATLWSNILTAHY